MLTTEVSVQKILENFAKKNGFEKTETGYKVDKEELIIEVGYQCGTLEIVVIDTNNEIDNAETLSCHYDIRNMRELERTDKRALRLIKKYSKISEFEGIEIEHFVYPYACYAQYEHEHFLKAIRLKITSNFVLNDITEEVLEFLITFLHHLIV